jgi:catechol 2,3-dioxygenase-like lactoylglutathione lyase family enzyme
MTNANSEFELRGVHHLALVCRDMARTVDFYTGVLGMPLVMTIELPQGMGQHFFFDIGNGDCLAFFWYPEAPEAEPGVSAPASFPIVGDSRSAVGSMNHVALAVPPEKFDEYVDKLHAKGITTSGITNHDDSERQVTRRMHDGVFLRSIYFFDPDGALLEFACWTRELGEQDLGVEPARALDHDTVAG